MKNYYKPAAGKVVAKLSNSRSGGSGVGKRKLNSIYKKNTGTTTKSRNARLRKYK